MTNRVEFLLAEKGAGARGAGSVSSAVTGRDNVGGIDFNPEVLNLQIKRDGNGVPLPLPQQPIGNMKIDGFLPVIINIEPVSIPLLLGVKEEKPVDKISLQTAGR